jgi:hypothetical protein
MLYVQRSPIGFLTEMESVYCVVRAGSLNKTDCASSLKRLAIISTLATATKVTTEHDEFWSLRKCTYFRRRIQNVLVYSGESRKLFKGRRVCLTTKNAVWQEKYNTCAIVFNYEKKHVKKNKTK